MTLIFFFSFFLRKPYSVHYIVFKLPTSQLKDYIGITLIEASIMIKMTGVILLLNKDWPTILETILEKY